MSAPREPPSRGAPSATPFEGEVWNALRQGARNVAGVRYQLAVTALLLAESRGRVLPFVEFVPEGYEDIDCLDRESTHWLVQVKEFGAGAGTFTASSMAESNRTRGPRTAYTGPDRCHHRRAPGRPSPRKRLEQAGLRNARLRHAEHHRGAYPARIQQRPTPAPS